MASKKKAKKAEPHMDLMARWFRAKGRVSQAERLQARIQQVVLEAKRREVNAFAAIEAEAGRGDVTVDQDVLLSVIELEKKLEEDQDV